jgi:transcriptional regulator with XRE-family HTH domain
MIIGDRLRELREEQNLSQGDIEKRTGLLCCYISRVENGHTVPSVETLEKFARALEVPVYQLFYEGSDEPADAPKKGAADGEWGSGGKDARVLARFRHLLSQTDESNRKLLLFAAQRMAKSRSKR